MQANRELALGNWSHIGVAVIEAFRYSDSSREILRAM